MKENAHAAAYRLAKAIMAYLGPSGFLMPKDEIQLHADILTLIEEWMKENFDED